MARHDADYSLALEEARRAFDLQQEVVDSLLGRAVSLLGIAGLVATFFGGFAVSEGDPLIGSWTWVAIGGFLLVAVCCVFVIWPRDWSLYFSPTRLVQWVEMDDRPSSAQMQRDLALHIEDRHSDNEDMAVWMFRAYTLAIGGLLVEVVGFLIQLRSR